MSLFNFGVEEILTFFGVLVRFSVLFSILPFVGDRLIPTPVKVLFAMIVSLALFPSLVSLGRLHTSEARVWGSSAGGIAATVALEALFGLMLGFVAKLVFEGISFGAHLVGNFMGFASASIYDPHQESQTEVIAQIQTTIAMLIFLALDGHHLMLRACLDSYSMVGLGKASLTTGFSHRLVQMTSEVIRFGLQLAGPVAISLFAVNVAFGVIAKAMPQLNILVLSFSVSALVGFTVMFLSLSEFHGGVQSIFEKMGLWLEVAKIAASGGG